MTIYFVPPAIYVHTYALIVAGVVAEHVKITNTDVGLPYHTSHLIAYFHRI
jgi:hypothetical protein